MKKQITTIVLGILMLAGVMAMYAGENMTFEINLTDPVYTVVGNSSNLTGLNVTFENGNITISTEQNYKPDNFTIIFFDNLTYIIDNTLPPTHSKGKTKYVDKNVTVYVPEYINTTEIVEIEVEVEKIIEKIIYNEDKFELWQLALFGAICLLFGIWAMNNWKTQHTSPHTEDIKGDLDDK